MHPDRRTTALIVGTALAATLLVAWLVYLPGLSGGFLFDDFANLPNLGAFGPIDNSTTFLHYITSGFADPTGRPLALLSFLVDAQDWPADPEPFKRTSVLLHLLNGVLLFWLLRKLGATLRGSERQVAFAALLGATLWLFHPLFVSTTLYIVQRETMLPATFVLVGLIAYSGSRERAARGLFSGVILSALSIATCTALGVLCKANAALLPLLTWIVDAIVLAPAEPMLHSNTRRAYAWMRRIVLIAPTLMLCLYLGNVAADGFASGLLGSRPWTLGERLLTEAHVLLTYLGLLWLPQPYTTGLFNDAFPVSHGLLSPPGTLFGLVAICSLMISAWPLRRRYPAFACAILFFFAGHLIESSVIPLELYYEHRNYLPALLMFWPLALWIFGVRAHSASCPNNVGGKPQLRTLRRTLAAVLPLGLAFLTFLSSNLWGNIADQALVWAIKNPDSPRAQAYAAQTELARGHVAAATTLLENGLTRNPDELQLTLNLLGARCQAGALTSADLDHAATALRTAPNTGRLGFDWFMRGLPIAQSGICPLLNLESLDRLLDAAGENIQMQKVPGRVQDRLHMQGRIALARGQAEQALQLFNAALDADRRPGAALEQAATLASAGYPLLAQQHLDHLATIWIPPAGRGWTMPSLHEWLLWKEGYWNHEIDHMRTLLAEDIARRDSASTSAPEEKQ